MTAAFRKWALPVLACAAVAAASGLSVQGRQGGRSRGVVHGVVTRYGTDEPIPDAAVTMRRGQGRRHTAVTDNEGKFTLEVELSGPMTITASKRNHLVPAQGAGPDMLWKTYNNRENVERVRLQLIPGGTLGGYVQDAAGRPAVRVPVSAPRRAWRGGRGVWEQSEIARTDASGAYRLEGLLPGEYTVRAEPEDGTPPVYLPGTVMAADAQSVQVGAGGEMAGLSLGLSAARPGRITGRVVQPPEIPGRLYGIAALHLLPRDAATAAGATLGSYRNWANRAGEFDLRDVPPGSYDLYAVMTTVPNSYLARAPVTVNWGEHAADVAAVADPGVEVQGRLTAVEAARPPQWTRVSVGLRLRDAPEADVLSKVVHDARVAADGTFTLKNVPAGRYWLKVAGSPSGLGLAEIREGRADILGEGLDVADRPPGPITIGYAMGTRLEGVVRAEDGGGAPFVKVVLAPPEGRRGNPDLYRSAMTDAEGRFAIEGVVEGGHTLFAWREIPENAEFAAAFIGRYDGRGTAVGVEAAERETARLRDLAVTLIAEP